MSHFSRLLFSEMLATVGESEECFPFLNDERFDM